MKIESGCLCMIVNTPEAGSIVTAIKYYGVAKLIRHGKERTEFDVWEISGSKSNDSGLACGEREANLERISGFDFSHEKEKELVE